MRLSPSYAITVEQCRLRARWLRIDKVDRATPDADIGLRHGKTVHAALEKLYQHIVDTDYIGPLHTPAILKVARESVDAAIAEHAGDFDADQQDRIRYQMLDHCLDRHQVAAGDVLGVEQFLQWPLRKGTNVVGFADRIDRGERGTVRVVDYKAGRRRWDESIVRSELQTQTYAVIATKRFPWARRVVVQIDMLGLRDRAAAGWSVDELAHLEQTLTDRYLAADDAMTDGPWDPSRGEWCDRCEFKQVCPAWGEQVPIGAWDPGLGRVRTEDDDQPPEPEEPEHEQGHLLPPTIATEPHGPRVERRGSRR